jgi:undecaprenyl-diphosphatase
MQLVQRNNNFTRTSYWDNVSGVNSLPVEHNDEVARLPMLNQIIRLDETAVIRLSGRRTRGLSMLMRAATRLGDGEFWVVFGVVVSIVADSGLVQFARLTTAYAIEFAAYATIKRLTSRPRPCVVLPDVVRLVAPPDEFSFPSGHTAAAFVMFTVLGSAYAALAVPLAVLSVLIGVSRVYLGVHYPSDVAAGALLGCLSGCVALYLI